MCRLGLLLLACACAQPPFSGGDGSAWQLFGPDDFRDGKLHADFAKLSSGERLGVVLVNADGRDDAQVNVAISGVGAVTASSRALHLAPFGLRSPALHAPEQPVERAAATEALAAEAHRAFCVAPALDFSKHVRKPATRVALTDHGAFYVDDEDLSHYEAPFIDALAAAFEQRVYPADVTAFGAPTDVDANGRVLVLLTHELGAHLSGGWLIGYFGNVDLLRARDNSAGCTDGGSNHAEIVYLNDVQNGGANGWNASDLSATLYPETLAHEIQHLLNLGHRCVQRECDAGEDTWINEALSKLAEDLAGYGWNGAIGRGQGAAYLTLSDGELRGYDGRSLTRWEGDPIGNYQGAHSFLRFFADRLGPQLAGAISSGAGGRDGLERALGMPLPVAMAQWASALLASNEPGAPFNYSGAPWSPLHERLRPLETRAPGQATLRTDGIAAFVSGAGSDGPAQVVVTSDDDPPPHVVVMRLPWP